MYLILEQDEHKLLLELLQSRGQELHPEIRRSQHHETRDALKEELQIVQRLIHRLHESEVDVRA